MEFLISQHLEKNLFWGLLLFVLAELCFLFISLVVSGKQRMANKFLVFFYYGSANMASGAFSFVRDSFDFGKVLVNFMNY